MIESKSFKTFASEFLSLFRDITSKINFKNRYSLKSKTFLKDKRSRYSHQLTSKLLWCGRTACVAQMI